jgi:CRP-like cAMP-binding protein
MMVSTVFNQLFPSIHLALGEEKTSQLLSSMTTLDLPAGRKLIRDRMPVDSLYFLMQGEVSISVEEGGRQIALGELGPGQWLGEVSILSGELLASSTVTANTAIQLLRMKHQAFADLMAQHPDISQVLLEQLTKMMTERLRTSLEAGTAPIAAADLEDPPKRGLLWALFGSNGG